VTSQGFPKSMNVSKAIDKILGGKKVTKEDESIPVEPPVSALEHTSMSPSESSGNTGRKATVAPYEHIQPTTPEAAKWTGYGTSLKPSFEPIIVARKPISEKNVALNILKYGTGALNIDATRVGSTEKDAQGQPLGRWTPNFALAHTEKCIHTGEESDSFVRNRTEEWTGFGQQEKPEYSTESISFATDIYKCADNCPVRILAEDSGMAIDSHGNGVTSKYFPAFMYHKKAAKSEKPVSEDGESHVSVKPLELMRWLVKLVTPEGGVVIDPFLGSGTTMEAARLENIRSIGVEAHIPYMGLIKQRIDRT